MRLFVLGNVTPLTQVKMKWCQSDKKRYEINLQEDCPIWPSWPDPTCSKCFAKLVVVETESKHIDLVTKFIQK